MTQDLETQKELQIRFETVLEKSQSEVEQLKTDLEAQRQQEENLQKIMDDRIQEGELQISKWEQKYSRTHENLQKAKDAPDLS